MAGSEARTHSITLHTASGEEGLERFWEGSLQKPEAGKVWPAGQVGCWWMGRAQGLKAGCLEKVLPPFFGYILGQIRWLLSLGFLLCKRGLTMLTVHGRPLQQCFATDCCHQREVVDLWRAGSCLGAEQGPRRCGHLVGMWFTLLPC